MLVTQDTGHERGQVGAGFCSTRLPGCGSDTGRSGEGRNSLGGAGETGLRGGWVGWKENMEGRTEVRAGVGKGEALRGQGRARKPWGGFGKGAIATQGEREGEGGKDRQLEGGKEKGREDLGGRLERNEWGRRAGRESQKQVGKELQVRELEHPGMRKGHESRPEGG